MLLPWALPCFLSASTLLHYPHPHCPHFTVPDAPGGTPPLPATLGHRLVQAPRADTKAPGQCLQCLGGKLDPGTRTAQMAAASWTQTSQPGVLGGTPAPADGSTGEG